MHTCHTSGAAGPQQRVRARPRAQDILEVPVLHTLIFLHSSQNLGGEWGGTRPTLRLLAPVGAQAAEELAAGIALRSRGAHPANARPIKLDREKLSYWRSRNCTGYGHTPVTAATPAPTPHSVTKVGSAALRQHKY